MEIETLLKIELITVIKKIIASNNQKSPLRKWVGIFITLVVIDAFKCLVALLKLGPLVFAECWEILFKYIEAKENTFLKCLSFQSFLICVDQSMFVQCLVVSLQEVKAG
jgi:hypothetical protein